MQRQAASLAAVVALTFVAVGCGGGNNMMNNNPDLLGVVQDLTGADLTGADLTGAPVDDLTVSNQDLRGADLTTPQPQPDLTGADLTMVNGTLLAAGANVSVLGITSDDYILYSDNTAHTFNVIKDTGGSPTQLADFGTDASSPTAFASVSGKAILIWENIADSQNIGNGDFAVWTFANGKKVGITATSQAGVGAVSSDGVTVVYTTNSDSGGNFGDYVVATTAAPQTQTMLLTSTLVFGSAGCAPAVAFSGASTILTRTCANGTTDAKLTSFTLTGTGTDLLTTGAALFLADDVGNRLVHVAANPGALSSFPVAAATATALDTNVATNLFLTKDGAAVIYRTAGALKRSATATTGVTTLVGTGVSFFRGLSPDEKFVLYRTTPNSGMGVDLFLASTMTAGTPTTIVGTATAESGQGIQGYGDSFTLDSGFVIYLDQLTTDGDGTLFTKPVGTGAAVMQGNGVWLAQQGPGSKVVFNDGHDITTSRGDIKSVDAASGGAKLIATGADDTFFMTTTKTKVVYTSHTATPNGMYIGTVP